MVTNAESTLTEVDSPAERVEHGIRYAIAGHPQGEVRRILLYGVVAVAAILAASTTPLAAVASIVALILLATTDQYV